MRQNKSENLSIPLRTHTV